jgi:hypothetical protein
MMEVHMKRNSITAIVRIFVLVTSSLLFAGMVAGAQEQKYPANEPQSQTQPAPPQEWSADQLDNLVAPIALYPDPLLSQVLVASTYPLEVVQASQWLQRNRNLRGQDLVNAAKQQQWDPSIQTLVVVPDTLEKLNEDIQWTTDLGEAFLAQEADVMNAVQRMRVRAQANGRLASTQQQKVITRQEGGQRIVVIEPAYPEVIYVPVYDPVYVWGPPAYGYYPPLYYPRFGFGFGIGFNIGFCFANWGGWGFWGWGPNWYGGTIFVNNYFFHNYGYHQHWGGGYRERPVWVHNPIHRLNVPYRTPHVAARFGGHSTIIRDSYRTGAGRNGIAGPYANGSESRFTVRNPDRGYRNASLPVQRNQNSPRQQYQSSPRFQSASNQNRVTTQAQRYQNQGQPRYQASQEYRSTQRTQEGPRVVPFGSQRQQQYQSPQQYRTTQQISRTPQVQQVQSVPQQRILSSQQYRSAQQTFRMPQVQQFRNMSQQRAQAPQQFRSAPLMSAPRISGGSVSRGGGGGSFSRGGGNRGR